MTILSRVNIAFSLFKGADLKGIKVMIRDLDDVLFRDVGGKIAADGRYTAIVDADSSINQSQLEARICTCIRHQSVTGKRHGWIGFVSLY